MRIPVTPVFRQVSRLDDDVKKAGLRPALWTSIRAISVWMTKAVSVGVSPCAFDLCPKCLAARSVADAGGSMAGSWLDVVLAH